MTASTKPPPAKAEPPTPARRLGRLAQGLVLGPLLLLALFELAAQVGNITPFRYQGF